MWPPGPGAGQALPVVYLALVWHSTEVGAQERERTELRVLPLAVASVSLSTCHKQRGKGVTSPSAASQLPHSGTQHPGATSTSQPLALFRLVQFPQRL